jgi:hypothetical protein
MICEMKGFFCPCFYEDSTHLGKLQYLASFRTGLPEVVFMSETGWLIPTNHFLSNFKEEGTSMQNHKQG